MHRPFALLLPFLLSLVLGAQTPPPPQTARQALIEMFLGTAPNHLQKHLPDATRKTLNKMSGANGMSALDEISMFSSLAKASGAKLETFDSGPILLEADDPRDGGKVELTVDGDNLSGEEDQIEVALHMSKNGKEENTLPFTPRVTFAMKMESDVWRLNEIIFTLHIPLGDPDFLKRIEEQQESQKEQAAKWGLQSIMTAENSYHAVHGNYACSLSDLRQNQQSKVGTPVAMNMLPDDLAGGKRSGYIFAITGCDGTQYRVVAEPETPGSGRALCSDESGAVRASADGKATTCLSSGEALEASYVLSGVHAAVPPNENSTTAQSRTAQPATHRRVRVSQGVSESFVISKVPPVYPTAARAARVQGSVVMQVLISQTGDVNEVNLVSGHPMLTPAAIDAVKQWKYRPYLLNGKPVEVDTQVTVNFSLSQ